MLDIDVSHSRQLQRRAKVAMSASVIPPSDSNVVSLKDSFIKAARYGDIESLKMFLCDDVIAYTDGGGRVSAALIPLQGLDKVVTVFSHLLKKASDSIEVEWVPTNQ